MSDETCPICALPWPEFCPLDGNRLAGPWTCPNVDERPAAVGEGASVAETEAPAPRGEEPASTEPPDSGASGADAEDSTPRKRRIVRHSTQPLGSGKVRRALAEEIRGGADEPAPEPRVAAEPGPEPTVIVEPEPEPTVIVAPESEPATEPKPVRKHAVRAAVRAESVPAAAEPGSTAKPDPLEALGFAVPRREEETPAPQPSDAPMRARIVRPGTARPPTPSDEDLKKTVLEISAITPDTLREKFPLKRKEGAPAKPTRRTKKKRGGVLGRIAKAVRSEADIARELAEAQPTGRRPAKGTEATDEARPRFSETQWFLQGAREDAELLEAKSSTERYLRDEDLSADERRKFTLRPEDMDQED